MAKDDSDISERDGHIQIRMGATEKSISFAVLIIVSLFLLFTTKFVELQIMSFYYLSPVRGDMPAHLLETIVVTRLEYLKAVFQGDTIVYNEHMVEGSIYDNVGHFIMCIVTILAENTDFKQFVLKAETELFKRRINMLSAYDLRRFAKRLLNSIKRADDTPSCDELKLLCQHLILKNIAHHISLSHNTKCSLHSIELNFKKCLMFVATRQVEIKQGIALLPCGKWLLYLQYLFSANLRYRIYKTDITPLRSDPRITDLLNKIGRSIRLFTNHNNTQVLSKDVDNLTNLFPPCMLNLHRNLRTRHRLSHTQRFFYSLFLKDIGMPVEEAIDFWRSEYRLKPSGTSTCCHNWEKDEKKYLYGIRHMYGLEGGRKKYTSVNCQRIQGSDNACSEGGCPFKTFDYQQMIKLLPGCPDSVLSQINEFRRKRQYNAACGIFLQSSLKTDCDSVHAHFSFTPVKYYMIASKN